MTAIIGPHIINGAGSHLATLRRWQPRLITVLDPDTGDMQRLREACPDSAIVGRVYAPDSEVEQRIRDGATQAAEWAHGLVKARWCAEVDYWQVANEVMQDYNSLPLLDTFERRRMHLAEQDGFRCAIHAFSVGNPDLPEHDRMALWRQVYPSLTMAQSGGHVVAVHQYGKPDMWQPDEDWFIHRLEHQVLPRLAEFPALKFAVTEFGIDGLIWSDDGVPRGWQHFATAAEYAKQLTDIGQYLERFSSRVLGYSVFTLGSNSPWQSYDIAGDVAEKLADYYESNDTGESESDVSEVNEAAGYGVKVSPSPAPTAWRVRKVRHLSGAENNGRHNVYVRVFDEDGNRDRNPALRIAWSWEGQRPDEQSPPAPLDKRDGETGHGDVPIERGQIITVSITGDGVDSDKVAGMHAMHGDEDKGNTYGHHSFAVEFQKRVGDVVAPPTEPPIEPPTGDLAEQVKRNAADIAALKSLLRQWTGD